LSTPDMECIDLSMRASERSEEATPHHRTGFPFLNLVYDGTEQANYATRLEAFMHQAREYAKTVSSPCGVQG